MADGLPDNVRRMVPRTTRGRGRVGISIQGLETGLHASDDQSQDPRFNPGVRRQLIDKHIGFMQAIFKARTPSVELSPKAIADIHSAVENSPNLTSESIAQTVQAATSSVITPNQQDAFKQHLAAKGVDEASYYAAIARFGSTLGSLDAILNAARNIRAGGSGYEASSGNMSNGVGDTGAGTYPDYGGTSFRSYGAAASYAYSNYGLQGGVTQQLWNLGVRNERQMQQVVKDTEHVSGGVSRGLGVTLSEAEKRKFTNDTAVPFARLRISAGPRTERHLDNTADYVRARAQLELEKEDAIRRNDKEAEGRAAAALRGLEVHHAGKTAGIAQSQEERDRAREANRAAWESYNRILQNNPQLRAQIKRPDEMVRLLNPEERARLEALGRQHANIVHGHTTPSAVTDYRVARADDTDNLLNSIPSPTSSPTASFAATPTSSPTGARVEVAQATATNSATPSSSSTPSSTPSTSAGTPSGAPKTQVAAAPTAAARPSGGPKAS